MKHFLLGTLCAVALGCNPSTPTTSHVDSTQEQPATITTNRPILDGRQATTQSFDDTNTTQMPAADPTRFNDGTSQTVDPDNSGVNVRDRDDLAKTPFDQNENKADIAITAGIRQRVVDTEMSVNAQNVKIITQDGKVTLRGPVQTDAEKQQIEAIALAIAGEGNVDSQLEVDRD
ncbi:MAG TPA: BON domain-containing protein [Pirellulaceae bacterium]|nr:BON domain-containing protein [Pirellulaceae bacterium]